jgi:anti-sigma B factor antagonist
VGIVTECVSGLRAWRPETPALIPDGALAQWPPALTMRVRREPGHVIVTVAGELDFATVSGLRARLSALAAAGRRLVVDLDQVSFIDAAGLGALAGAATQAAGHGTSLHVVCARRQTRRLFSITGLDREIPLAGTLAEALRDGPAIQAAGGGVGSKYR